MIPADPTPNNNPTNANFFIFIDSILYLSTLSFLFL